MAVAINERFACDGASFAPAVAAVDASLDLAATRTLVRQRLQALGARENVDAVTSRSRERLAELLVPVIEQTPRLAATAARSPLLEQAADQVRSRWFSDVEAQCKDYDDRRQRERSLVAVAEWTAWSVLRDRGDRLLALAPDSESALFQTMYVRVCNFAVFQHNVCRRRYLAYEIYSWLHRHCGSDQAAARLLAGNMRASESV
jgi:hypothetical protein